MSTPLPPSEEAPMGLRIASIIAVIVPIIFTGGGTPSGEGKHRPWVKK